MKTKILFVAILFIAISKLHAQNSKHGISSGKLIFDITYPDSQLDAQTLANLPSESVMKFSGDKLRVESTMPMGKTIVISDNKTGNAIMLMDIMGNKMAMDIDKDQIQKEKEGSAKPTVEMTRETKIIAGYTCTKAIITMPSKEGLGTFDAWFTNELKIKNSFASQIEGIDGFLMEFYTAQNGMNMKMTARSVEPMKIDESEFTIPEGYKKVNMDDLKKMGGQH